MDIPRKYATKVLKRVHGALGEILETFNTPIHNKVVSLQPEGPVRGHVLLSYKIELFLTKPGQPISYYHYGCQLAVVMARTFVELGFAVDVISNGNKGFLPKKKYDFFLDTRMNFERLAPLLNRDCVKILYATTAHPYFNNSAELKRLMALQERRHVTLRARRFMPPSYAMAVEYADCIFILSEFSRTLYGYASKPLFLVPNVSPQEYPWPDEKKMDTCRTRFLWLGSLGMVHKGLDLVLEAFAKMPEFHLTVCGPVAEEKDFEKAYYRELYHTPNIHTFGWIDTASSEFVQLANDCIGFVYPSCSEASAGAVLTGMHVGLIPIISFESGVDVSKEAGIVLDECSIEAIQEAVHRIASRSSQELRRMSRKSWEFAQEHHTVKSFEKEIHVVLEKLMHEYKK